MTMHKALHTRDVVGWLYMPRKERGSGLAIIEDSVDASIQRFEDYKSVEEEGLQPPEAITTTWGPTEGQ